MITINNRTELNEALYCSGIPEYSSPDTLVGIAIIGGELLAEALSNEYNQIDGFFPYGSEGEFIIVDAAGNVVEDFLYY